MIGLWLDEELLEAIDQARIQHGIARSQFIRNAIYSRVQDLGFDLPPDIVFAPDRTKNFSSISGNKKQESESEPSNSKPQNPESREKVNAALKEAAEKLAHHAKEKVAARRARCKKANT